MQAHRLRADDPHRLVCPRDHSGWEPVNGHFWCEACARSDWPGDGSFDRVEDKLTGDMLDREDVRDLEQRLGKS